MTILALPRGRHSAGSVLVVGATLVLLLVTVLGGVAAEISSGDPLPSGTAIADIPTNYLVQYIRAARRFSLDWAVLAAIGKIECDHGRSRAAGCNPRGTLNPAGATGPM